MKNFGFELSRQARECQFQSWQKERGARFKLLPFFTNLIRAGRQSSPGEAPGIGSAVLALPNDGAGLGTGPPWVTGGAGGA